MRLLVIGANGLLGSNVVRSGRTRGWDVQGTFHSTSPAFDIPLSKLDIRDSESVRDILDEHEPDVVVNCAAMTDVDGCESNPEQAYAINGQAPGTLAACCGEREIQFTHISTDYVFDGTATTPYATDAIPNPIQVYGASKLQGEQQVQETAMETLIARLSFVYGVHRDCDELTGFPAWVRDRLVAGEQTPLFTGQRITPTRAGQAAETLLDLLVYEKTGVYHIASRSCVTPYEFGIGIQQRTDAPKHLLREGSQADVDRPADRPLYTGLDVSNVESALNRPQPSLAEDLDQIEIKRVS